MYPADESTLNETGVPKELQVERQAKTSLSGASIYLCRHPECQKCPFHAQSEAGIYSHIRRKHLGIVVACPYCAKKLFWNTKGWRAHMEHHHREAPWYGSTLMASVKSPPRKCRRAPMTPEPAEESSSDSSPDSATSSDSDSDSDPPRDMPPLEGV